MIKFLLFSSIICTDVLSSGLDFFNLDSLMLTEDFDVTPNMSVDSLFSDLNLKCDTCGFGYAKPRLILMEELINFAGKSRSCGEWSRFSNFHFSSLNLRERDLVAEVALFKNVKYNGEIHSLIGLVGRSQKCYPNYFRILLINLRNIVIIDYTNYFP